MQQPLKVIHANSWDSDNRTELVDLAANNLFMSKTERALLHFYSRQANGFRPARKRIANVLGVDPTAIFKCRNKLTSHGCAYILDDSFIVDWERIRIFASLDKSMCSRSSVIAQAHPAKLDPHEYCLEQESWPVGKLVEFFANMSQESYDAWRAKRRRIMEQEEPNDWKKVTHKVTCDKTMSFVPVANFSFLEYTDDCTGDLPIEDNSEPCILFSDLEDLCPEDTATRERLVRQMQEIIEKMPP